MAEEEEEGTAPAEDEGSPSDSANGGLAEGERQNWRQNAVVLYDLFIGCCLEWPALAVAWLPDEPDEGCRLAIGMHTDGSVPHELVVAELACNVEPRLNVDDLWRVWEIEGLGAAEGFGCSVEGPGGPLRPLARMAHPTEVNCVAPCPHRAQLIATKAASGAVLLYDYKAERPASGVHPDVQLAAPDPSVDGFALGWSHLQKQLLASGGNDGRLCVWDTVDGASAPLHSSVAHKGALCDLCFSHAQASLLASVGDDGLLQLWDSRAAKTAQLSVVVSQDEVLCVDWSHHWEHVLATAGKEREVRVWDLRAPAKPLHALRGHKGDAVAVRWAPFKEALLASGSTDSRLHIWDLTSQATAEEEEEEAPELLFAHGGHEAGISAFAWSAVDDFLVCSVAEDNALQIWQPSTVFYLADSEGEEEAPRCKEREEHSRPQPSQPETERPGKRARVTPTAVRDLGQSPSAG